MLHPLDFLKTIKNTHGQQLLNILREYLQVMALKIIYGAKESEHLRFGGGTCLRICHNLPRFSEDLDFSMDKKIDTTKLIRTLEKGFRNYNVNFELSVPKSVERKRVAKYWLKFSELVNKIGHSPHESEKLAIKLEIDKFPPKNGRGEFFYVEKFNEYFPIYKSDLPTLFAGKISAVHHRGYQAMRDYYDLLWYLNKGVEPNYQELQELHIEAHNQTDLINILREKTKHVDGKELANVIAKFLENPEEKKAFQNYQTAFQSASMRFLEKSQTQKFSL